MKKSLAITMVIVLILCTGCASRKVAISPQEFTELMKVEGFEVQDTTELYDSPLVQESLGAVNDSFTIELLIAPTEANANQIFNQTKASSELSKGNSSSESSSALGNKARYTLNSSGAYYVLSQIDNTVLYVETESANKSAVDDIVKKLGY